MSDSSGFLALVGFRGSYRPREPYYFYPPEGSVTHRPPATGPWSMNQYETCVFCEEHFRVSLEGAEVHVMCCSQKCSRKHRGLTEEDNKKGSHPRFHRKRSSIEDALDETKQNIAVMQSL